MVAPAPRHRYRYRVDASDVVTWVDAMWLAFAKENGAAELVEESVVGRTLWDFLAGDDIRRLYREIHSRVRTTGKSVLLPFRCDSPSLQRHMRMTITLRDAGELEYESRVDRTIPQRRLDALDPQRQRSNVVLKICSCCRRAFFEPLGWLDMEDVSVRLGLFETTKVPELCYVICPECAAAFQEGAAGDETP